MKVYILLLLASALGVCADRLVIRVHELREQSRQREELLRKFAPPGRSDLDDMS